MAHGLIPQFMVDEQRHAMRWRLCWSLAGVSLWLLLLVLCPLFLWLLSQPLSIETYRVVSGYAFVLWPNIFGPVIEMFSSPHSHVSLANASFAVVVTCGVGLGLTFFGWSASPYRAVAMIHGDARFADRRDLRLMDEGGKLGPSGKYLHLGYAYGQRLSLIETVSVQLLAPPGTGKTTRFVIPAILGTDDCCFIVHDPKPELWDLCSGWADHVGRAYRLDWGKVDVPEQGVFYPRFNFISKRVVPPAGPARDTFIDSIAKVLVPDKDGGGDKYFVDQGRSALVGFSQYLIALVNDDTANKERYAGLPEVWQGREASFPMLVDWISYSQQEAQKKASAPARGGQPAQPDPDPLRTWLSTLVDTAIARSYPQRCIRDLQPLINMADKERSGVLGTMNQGLLPFRNSAVAERTSASDFSPVDLGGALRREALVELGLDALPEGAEAWDAIIGKLRPDMWEPVSVFVCVNQAEASAFESLTALFFEVCSRELISYGPGERTRLGSIMGPFPTCFLMDELVKMSRCDAVVDGPDLGRGKKRFFLLVAQAIAQIQRRYSKEQRDTIMSTCAVRAVLPQNDKDSIREIADTVGKTTVKRASFSRQVGLKGTPFSANRSESIEGVSLLSEANLASMKAGHHILIVQDFLNRPIDCVSCVYFADPLMRSRSYNPHAAPGKQGFAPALPLPLDSHTERLAEYKALDEAAEREEAYVAREARFDDWRHYWDPDVLTSTPDGSP